MTPRALAAACLGLALLVAVPAPSGAAIEDPAHKITSQLICPCSCGEVLSGCTCETGVSMKGYVSSEIKAGKSKDEIVGALVAQYGEVIRGAPKPKGFNLIVWIAPFAATLIGLIIASTVLLRWVGRRAPVPAGAGFPAGGAADAAPGSSAEADLDALRARAEAELRRLRGGSGESTP